MINLTDNWSLVGSSANEFNHPSELASLETWLPAIVPGTVAQSLQQAGTWSLIENKDFVASFDAGFDHKDWWYKTSFSLDVENRDKTISFAGLASLSEVWLNGRLILTTDNMFLAYKVNVSDVIQSRNELFICFRSLSQALSKKRPRPRWKTRVVEHQQLRWFRTTLLGKIPGWTPPVSAVGPWNAITVHEPTEIDIRAVIVKTSVDDAQGIVDFELPLPFSNIDKVSAKLEINNKITELSVNESAQGHSLIGQLKIDNVEYWWPHTHGVPILYNITLKTTINGYDAKYTLTPIGFKQIEIDQSKNNFVVKVNGQEIFCRGACWTINDIVSLNGEDKNLEDTLNLMRDAGANMIRIGGTMIYEQDRFYQICDKLGILVWQDFMFANMDYPIDDKAFNDSVQCEIQQVVQRLAKHVSVSVFCGNSEIEQQVSMLGLDQAMWQGRLFTEVIPSLLRKYNDSVPYISSSPTGGALPFHVNTGLAHYYAVGAYLRPVSEVRRHDVKFSSECLGFANIPIAQTRNEVLNGQTPLTHDPRWKARTPRDSGAGWDFEDVRDHYLNELYNVDPTSLRSFETEKYISLSELTSGEVMMQVFAEWRSKASHCMGGLVWFLKDFWPGAGWGIIDSHGLPKACYYYLKRAWQPLSLHLTNEDINGVAIHIVNEGDKMSGQLNVSLINELGEVMTSAHQLVVVNRGERYRVTVDEILMRFYDVAYAYRFGPAKHTVVAVRFTTRDEDGADVNLTNEAFLFPQKLEISRQIKANLTAKARQISDNEYQLELESDVFLYAVCIDTPGFIADNNYFHMLPERTVKVLLRRVADAGSNTVDEARLKGYVSALNSDDVKIKNVSN